MVISEADETVPVPVTVKVYVPSSASLLFMVIVVDFAPAVDGLNAIVKVVVPLAEMGLVVELVFNVKSAVFELVILE